MKARTKTLCCCALLLFITLFSLYQSLKPRRIQWLSPVFHQNILQNRNYRTHIHEFRQTRLPRNGTMKILLWTKYFGHTYWYRQPETAFSSCNISDCEFTADKTELSSSDAVLFHARDLWYGKFLFRSLPKRQRIDQVWVLANNESAVNEPADFSNIDVLFNWTMNYRRDSDVYVPYGALRLRDSLLPTAVIPERKWKGVLWVSSNCADDMNRQVLVQELQKHIQVDAYGKCGELGDKSFYWQDYKFYLAFENSYCKDYITEKFWNALKHNQIPVVLGGGDYKTEAPPHSYIDVKDFPSMRHLADYLNYLDRNDTAYNEYFEWTRRYTVVTKDMFCELCAQLHSPHQHQMYPNMEAYIRDDICDKFTMRSFIYRYLQGHAIRLGIL